MGYYTGNLTTSTTWHADMRAAIEGAATTDVNWSVAVSGYDDGTFIRSVIKCDDATDSFYAIFFHVKNPATGAVVNSPFMVIVCEDYNTSTHELLRPCRLTSPNLAAASNNSVSLSAMTLTTALTDHGALDLLSISSSSIRIASYKMSLLPTGIWMQTLNNATNQYRNIHAEYFTSTVENAATNDPKPLCLIQIGGNTWLRTSNTLTASISTNSGGVSRSPFAYAGSAGFDWRVTIYPWHNGDLFRISGGTNFQSLNRDMYSSDPNGFYASYIGLRRLTTSDSATFGLVRGRLNYAICGPGTTTGGGDTTTLNGVDYELSLWGGIWQEIG